MLSYEDRLNIYKEEYAVYDFGVSVKDSHKLVSLLCILTIALRKKTPTVKVEDVLVKCGVTREAYYDFVEKLSINCDCILKYDKPELDSYGFTKAADMVTEIKRIMETYLPF